MDRKDKGKEESAAQSSPGDRPWNHLGWRGDVIVLCERCTSTASGVRADYQELRQEIREAAQYINRKLESQKPEFILKGIKQDFHGSILVGDAEHPGYFYDTEVQKLIQSPGQSPSDLAIEKIAARLSLTQETVRTYTKRRSKKKTPKRRPTHSS
jgi:hypothetical protein